MKALVLYKSKTGFTRKYAEWIAEELSCECADADKFDYNTAGNYGIIVYGGGLYAGRINGLKKFLKNFKFNGKNLIVFAVGSSLEEEKTAEQTKAHNLQDVYKSAPLFYFMGGMDIDKVNPFFRLLIKIMHNSIKKKNVKTPQETALENSFRTADELADKSKVYPLAALVKERLSGE